MNNNGQYIIKPSNWKPLVVLNKETLNATDDYRNNRMYSVRSGAVVVDKFWRIDYI